MQLYKHKNTTSKLERKAAETPLPRVALVKSSPAKITIKAVHQSCSMADLFVNAALHRIRGAWRQTRNRARGQGRPQTGAIQNSLNEVLPKVLQLLP
jgi:hypothetical protein